MNYYILNSNSVMQFRGTLEMCRAWVHRTQAQWRAYGMPVPVYRLFYDTATEPVETFHMEQYNATSETTTTNERTQ